jgi:hypothetical protein
MSEQQTLIKKSEFAAARGVSSARVSQWIATGLIGPEAIVGEGQRAKINEGIATAHLRDRLDPSQRFSINGLSTRLGNAKPPSAPGKKVSAKPTATRRAVEAIDEDPGVRMVREEDTVESKLKANKLRQAVLQTELLEEEANFRKGLYVETTAARGAASNYPPRGLPTSSLRSVIFHRSGGQVRRVWPRYAASFAIRVEAPSG